MRVSVIFDTQFGTNYTLAMSMPSYVKNCSQACDTVLFTSEHGVIIHILFSPWKVPYYLILCEYYEMFCPAITDEEEDIFLNYNKISVFCFYLYM